MIQSSPLPSSSVDAPKDETLPSTPGVTGNNRGCSRVVSSCGSSAPPAQSPPLIPTDPFEGNPGIGFALGKIYRDHLKVPVPDYLKPLVEAGDLVKKEATKAVPSQGQKCPYEGDVTP